MLFNTPTHRVEQGTGALRAGQPQQAGEHFLIAARELLLLARQAPPPQQSVRLRQADRLRALGLELLNRPKSPSASTEDGHFSALHSALGFDAVAGAQQVKKILRRRVLTPLANRQQASRYGVEPASGVLLYGPPGTGKTHLVRALVGELGCPLYAVSADQLLGSLVGQSEQRLAELFEQASAHPQAVIFIDELDGVFPQRDQAGNHSVTISLINVLLQKLDGFEGRRGNILFVGATNRPWAIEPSLLRPRRIDTLIEIPLPDQADRLALLHHYANGIPFEGVDWSPWAQGTDGYSAADLGNLVNSASQAAFMHSIETGEERAVRDEDLQQAFAELGGPSVKPAHLEAYRAFARQADVG